MAYIGKELLGILSYNKVMDSMTGDGSDTTLTLSRTPGSVNNVEVFMDGICQTPGTEYTLSGNTLTFTTAPETGVKVVAISGNDSIVREPNDNSITGAKILDNSVTNAKIDGLSASKLTGDLPALSGASLTNVPTGVTTSTNDPTISTNPSGGVGTLWVNKTSGEMYVCTNATAGANIWTNVGTGTGDVMPFVFQGTISGYVSSTNDIGNGDIIDKFSLVSDANATDVGNLTVKRLNGAGGCSSTHGYHAGGYTGVENSSNIIDKYTFAADNDATDVGDLTVGRSYNNGQSSSTHCYATGGAATWHANSESDRIDKWTTSSDANATDVGNLTLARQQNTAGQSSEAHGYTCGGTHPPGATYTNRIDKFTFASDNDATDHGDMTTSRNQAAGQSSTTHGYITGGYSPNTDKIEKFTFGSNSNAADVGVLTVGNRWSISGQSSTTHGYTSGGYNGSAVLNRIDKFTFASNNDATDVGDLTVARNQTAGTQN